jgi:hypothetical protein
MKYRLVEVERFPETFDPGTIYWSEEFEMSAHICACGCKDVVMLPIGPVDFSLSLGPQGPTLRPSVGNWGVCDAHYFITNGEVQWQSQLSPAQIAASRAWEDARRSAYYDQAPQHWFARLMWHIRKILRWSQ